MPLLDNGVLPGPGAIAVRAVTAGAVMVGAAASPALVSFIPGIGQLARLSTSPLGSGPLGVAVMCAVSAVVCAVATVVAVLAVTVLTRTVDRGRRIDLGLRADRRGLLWAAAMLLVALVITGLTAGVLHLAGAQGPVADPMASVPVELRTWPRLVAAVSLGFLLQGIPEEVVWRGWFYASAGSTRLAAAVSVLAFTVAHLASSGGQQSWGQRVVYLVMPLGLATAAMAARVVSGSLWPAIGVHGGLHLTNDLLAHHLGVPRQPSTWVTVGLLWAVTGVVVLGLGRWRQKLRRTGHPRGTGPEVTG